MLFLIFLAYLVGIFVLLVAVAFVADLALRSKGYRGPVSTHFDGTKFLNMKVGVPTAPKQGFGAVMRWMLSRPKNVWEDRAVEPAVPAARVEGSELVATLVNHATVLIQTQGINILTDPIYSKRASPFTFAGPRRFTAPGIAFDDLPKIDAVLISHNHYDHLDLATLTRLMKRDAPRIFAPLGNEAFLASHGIQATELDWWQAEQLSDVISLTCVPAQHFSARALSDRNKTLWSGYAITTPAGSVYFAGDTGYGPFVEQIAERFPQGFRLGLLPIGAFRPEWFMREVHISPEEAFRIQQQLNIQDVLAIHFGTFKLADDGQDEPAQHVYALAAKLPASRRFVALPNGSSVRVP